MSLVLWMAACAAFVIAAGLMIVGNWDVATKVSALALVLGLAARWRYLHE